MKTIVINSIVKETAKAVLVSLPVTWACNMHKKEMWFPKSVIGDKNERTMEVQDWFVEKQEFANVFHGYVMRFELIK